MTLRSSCFFIAILLLGASHSAVVSAAMPEYVQAFFKDLQTLQADFDQHVMDSNKQTTQSSQGKMWIRRPGQFRWNYETPYKQQLVADGERLWSYDEDLEQVTVRPAAEVLTSTPAMLLSGEQPLDEVFLVEKQTAGDSVQSVMLSPKSDDSNIVSLELLFNEGLINRIVALDSFGNTTTFSFSDVNRNPVLDDSVFHFDPPPGVDVIGDQD